MSTNSGSEPSASIRRPVINRRPSCQVVITVTMTMAMTSGSQPPCTTLVRLAAKKVSSTPPNTTPIRIRLHLGQCQLDPARIRNRVVVRISVPVTASPYAVASLFDDRNDTISTSTPANNSQLTAGT